MAEKRVFKPIMWGTTYGQRIEISKLSHQHLSNILYYFELLVPDVVLHPKLNEELNKRFLGVRLPYRPQISFGQEIRALISKGYTTGEPDADIIVDGKVIGQVLYL